MKRKNKIPSIKNPARKLAYVCLSIILVYMLCFAAFTIHISPFLAEQIIQSALAATAISLAGTLLLDIEIRYAEDKS